MDELTPLPAPVSVQVKPSARRAAFLSEEATVAALAGREDVAKWLKERAFAWLVGQRG